jgi:hypothetical protein
MINRVERETGFEPATLGMGGRCSTPELLPHGANYTLDLGLSSSLRAVTHSVMFRRAAQASVCPSARVISVFAVRFKHRPHPNPPRGRGGNRDSSPVHGGGWEGGIFPVHGGGWEGGILKNQRKGTYQSRGQSLPIGYTPAYPTHRRNTYARTKTHMRRCWTVRGVRWCPRVERSYKWRYLPVAIDPLSGEVWQRWSERLGREEAATLSSYSQAPSC